MMHRIVYSLIFLLITFQAQAQMQFEVNNSSLTAYDLKAFIGKDTIGEFKERIYRQSYKAVEVDSIVGNEAVHKYFFDKYQLGFPEDVFATSCEIRLVDFFKTEKDVFFFYKVNTGFLNQFLHVLWISNDIVKGEYVGCLAMAGCGEGGAVSLLKMYRKKNLFVYKTTGDRKARRVGTFKYKITPGKGLIKI